MAVKVQFEIGHHSKLRSKKSPEGFTHDWELYVQGVNKADISTFVEKVVFNLHDTFPKPKRVLKEPPYAIQESGYAGFTLPIDIYFRNRDEPKRVRFEYDLDLQNSGPPQHRSEVKNFIFECPAEEFRSKLLKGGGVPVAGVMSGGINETPSLMTSSNLGNDDGGGMVSKPKLSGGSDKKHKSRPDDAKLNTFANLFGPPITKTTKPSPDNKTLSGSSLITNNAIVTISSLNKEKSSKDKSGSGSSEKTKDKSDKKDKHKQISPHKDKEKKSSSSEKRSSESKKDKTRDKEHSNNRDKSNSSNSRDGSMQKRAQSHTSDLSVASPKKIAPPSPRALAMATNDSKLLAANSSGNIKTIDITTEIKTKESIKPKDQSSSSGKKSKKDKKDKDKDRERDKDKEKQRNSGETKTKDVLPTGVNNTSIAAVGTNESKKIMPAAHMGSSSNVSKKGDKEAKLQAPKVSEKPNTEREVTNASQNNIVGEKNEKKSSSSKDVNSEKDKKSHKHKKKDKSKDKDKERERDKDKNKERERDKDRDKQEEKKGISTESIVTTTVTPTNTIPTVNLLNEVSKADVPVNTTPPVPAPKPLNVTTTTPTPTLTANTVNIMNSISPTKKSQNKEKKSKDKGSKDELKRQRDASLEVTTNSKKKSKTTTNKNNLHDLELSDVDSVQSTTDILTVSNANNNTTPIPKTTTTNAITTIIEPSDSSNSSFPDLPPKPRNNVQMQQVKTIAASPTPISTTITKDLGKSKATNIQSNITNNITKESKQRSDKSSKSSEKLEKHEKVNKPEKDNKKRKRSNAQQQQQQQQQQNAQTISTNTFIEPPVKLAKKDQTKTAREKSKSPALRASTTTTATNLINNNSSTGTTSSTGTSSSSGSSTPTAASVNTFLPPPSTTAVTVINSSNNNNHLASPANNNNNNISNNNNNSTTNELIAATTPTPTINNTSTLAANAALIPPPAPATAVAATTWPTEYLNELQELHHKIMTLQDNEELQQVVEMIAATGCYEITTKTFDFDLCKLDRNTVQRLQEFLATCVS